MKVLNITHFGSLTNYGELLQAYALQTALRSLRHDAVLLRASFSLHNQLRKWYKSPLNACRAWLTHRAALRDENRHPRDFAGFIARNMKATEEVFHTHRELLRADLKADALITGSDQVWSSKRPFPPYFLDFGPKDALRISYAASVGSKARFGEDYLRDFAARLRRFSAVSVRETEALEQCRRAGSPRAVLVPDPVLLLEADHYRKRFFSPELLPEKPFCLIYLVSCRNFPWEEVCRHAQTRGEEPVVVCSQRSTVPKGVEKTARVVYPDLPQWLTLIDRARLTITDSFHGTLVSLLFGTAPAVVRKNSHDARFDTLFSHFPSARREWRELFFGGGDAPDFPAIHEKMRSLREIGFAFLRDALPEK